MVYDIIILKMIFKKKFLKIKMSYMKRCLIDHDIYLKKLTHSRNIVIFIYNDDLIPVTKKDLKKLLSSWTEGLNTATNKTSRFFKIPGEIWIDESLLKCYEKKYNTIKLQRKGGFTSKYDWYESDECDCYIALPIQRKEIDSEEPDTFENEESKIEGNIDWNEIKKQNEIEKEKDTYRTEEVLLGDNRKYVKGFVNNILTDERLFENNKLNSVKSPDGTELPAMITYHGNGNKSVEYWYKDGVQHRGYGLPAVISYDKNGKVRSETMILNGKQY